MHHAFFQIHTGNHLLDGRDQHSGTAFPGNVVHIICPGGGYIFHHAVFHRRITGINDPQADEILDKVNPRGPA